MNLLNIDAFYQYVVRGAILLADISVAVIRERAKRSRTARQSELVNNCAVGQATARFKPDDALLRFLTSL